MSIVRTLWEVVRPDPDEKIQQAQKYLARCISEEQYNHEMCRFYDNRCTALYPQARDCAGTAFRFAESLKCFKDHFADAARWCDRAAEARAKLYALMGDAA